MVLSHSELCCSLADVKNTIYIECNLGSKWGAMYANMKLTGDDRVKCQQADVINIRPSYTRFCVDIYEVKASRADF